MQFKHLFSWLGGARRPAARQRKHPPVRSPLRLQELEDRRLLAGYLAVGAGAGGLPLVAIRCDIRDLQGLSTGTTNNQIINPPGLGQNPPSSDGITDITSQVFMPFAANFHGGVRTATGNFDGDYTTPNSLVTAAGPGGAPLVIVWKMKQNADGTIVTNGIQDQFFAYDPRFTGGVTVTAGDLDGDGRAELITGAGAGGGPAVHIYKADASGHFHLAFQFYAYDPKFTGGVNVASNQGYNTPTQVRQVVSTQFPDPQTGPPFFPTPYATARIPSSPPGSAQGIPLLGTDDFNILRREVDPGEVGFSSNTRDTANAGRFLPYFTVASGNVQYLGGNLTNNFGNTAYLPNNLFSPTPPNPANSQGQLVYASWPMNPMHPPDFPFVPGAVYGPFVQLPPTNSMVPQIRRLTDGPGQSSFKNQLVTGAGPGGGPHVRVWDFSGSTIGSNGFTNITFGVPGGVVKQFFAFVPNFSGGVNVAIGNVEANPTAGTVYGLPTTPVTPSLAAYENHFFVPQQPIINLTKGLNVATSTYPINPLAYQNYEAQIICGMQTGGQTVTVWSDSDPTPTPSTFTGPKSLGQVNLVSLMLDQGPVLVPGSPLSGFFGTTEVTGLTHGIDPAFTGGVNVAVSGLAFNGANGGSVAGGLIVSSNSSRQTPSRGAKVRIFAQPSGLSPTILPDYNPIDDFSVFNQPNIGVSNVSFGFGVLPPPVLQVTELTPIAVGSVSDPQLS